MSLFCKDSFLSFFSRYLLVGVVVVLSIPSANSQQQARQQGQPPSKRNPKIPREYKPWKWRPGSYEELHSPTAQQTLAMVPAGCAAPVYGAAQFTSGQTYLDAFGKHTVMVLSSNDGYTNVAQWYKGALKGAGWQLRESAPLPGTSTQTFTGYKTGKYCRVQVSKKEPGCSIYISLKESQ